jgi:MFS superfamily sulfate permease-like transporter
LSEYRRGYPVPILTSCSVRAAFLNLVAYTLMVDQGVEALFLEDAMAPPGTWTPIDIVVLLTFLAGAVAWAIGYTRLGDVLTFGVLGFVLGEVYMNHRLRD